MLENIFYYSIVNVCRAQVHSSKTIVCESFVGFTTTQFVSGDLEIAHLVVRNQIPMIRFTIQCTCTRNSLDGFYSTRKLLVLSMAGR